MILKGIISGIFSCNAGHSCAHRLNCWKNRKNIQTVINALSFISLWLILGPRTVWMLRKLGWFSLGFTFGPFFVKGIVHFEIKIWYLSAYPKGIQDVGVFFSSVDPILMFLGQTVLVCQSYNGRYNKKIPRSCVSTTLQTRPPSSVDADAPCECNVSQSAHTHTSHTGCVCALRSLGHGCVQEV